MNRYLSLILFCCCLVTGLSAQDKPLAQDSLNLADTGNKKAVIHQTVIPGIDSSAKKDTLQVKVDSLPVSAPAPVLPVDFSKSMYQRVLKENKYFNFTGKAVYRIITPRTNVGKDDIFYLLAALFFLLAIVRASFGRYFQNLFAVFFRASMKQKQIREQLLQTPLASLFLNLLFIGTGSLLVTFILQDRVKSGGDVISIWWLYGYSAGGLTLLYLGKYFILKMIGWTLKMEATTDTYIFIVFMCNKVMAIFLLPLLLVAAFGSADVKTVAMTLAYVVVVAIFAYRYISSYGYINREVRTSRFHFFLYLCAFEVAPLLLIYKVLLKIV
ncbi:DUF4271 domain-containing protein [Flavihumibacter profundi]|uniref:DUF4271 domain-containing protein n=1 Tax=Flavihumibacter profundi TaxID=2716883 RepID=UPI001CC6AC1A|nr:DUF4271 domain-containing protein [Flavihumibacter profundi]MBZ5858052.1 DUF4271 domain-containing protein [Flavihumibacter profundi]